VADFPDNTPKPVVALSYAHDEMGNLVQVALVPALEHAGLDVRHDRHVRFLNSSGKEAEMAHLIENYPVIVILSPDYVAHCGKRDGSAERKGVGFESRLVYRKIHDHTHEKRSPVIPVATPDFPIDRVPYALSMLVVSRFDPATGAGIDQIVQRVRDLYSAGPPAVAVPLQPVGLPDAGQSRLRRPEQLVQDIAMIDPSDPAALGLVRELLRFPKDRSVNVTDIFWPAEQVLRLAGDAELMYELSERCLEILDGVTPMKADKLMKATNLICGRALLLCLRKDFTGALAASTEGVALAAACDAPWLEALGRRGLGHIHRELAEDPATADPHGHLRQSVRSATLAIRIFTQIGQKEKNGLCTHILARSYLAEYQLTGSGRALRRAAIEAEKAVRHFPTDDQRERHALLLLRAEIAVASNDAERAQQLVNNVGELLTKRIDDPADGELDRDLFARALLVDAELRYSTQRGKALDVLRDAEQALKIFEDEGMRLHAAACRWLLLKVARQPNEVSCRDIKTLERLSANPHTRLRAVEEDARRHDQHAKRCRSRHWELRAVLRAVAKSR
jgi:hypothetical protein